MNKQQLRVVLALLIATFIFVLFLKAGAYMLVAMTTTDATNATPTPPPVIEIPTGIATTAPGPTVTAVKVLHPLGSITPTVGAGKVFVTLKNDPASAPVSAFKSGSGSPYCWVASKALPIGTSATFSWRDSGSNQFLWQYPEARQGGPYTGSYYPYAGNHTGKYECDVTVNGQSVGSVSFTVTS